MPVYPLGKDWTPGDIAKDVVEIVRRQGVSPELVQKIQERLVDEMKLVTANVQRALDSLGLPDVFYVRLDTRDGLIEAGIGLTLVTILPGALHYDLRSKAEPPVTLPFEQVGIGIINPKMDEARPMVLRIVTDGEEIIEALSGELPARVVAQGATNDRIEKSLRPGEQVTYRAGESDLLLALPVIDKGWLEDFSGADGADIFLARDDGATYAVQPSKRQVEVFMTKRSVSRELARDPVRVGPISRW
ncbi:MAG: hypothetical protein AAB588_00455 [Patescibacteria group bacterium]